MLLDFVGSIEAPLPRIHLNNAGQWAAAELGAKAWQSAGSIIESSSRDRLNKWKLEAERLRADLEKAAQKWYADVIELHRRINKANAGAASLAEQLWSAREEAENHRNTIDVLMKSTSWRLTWPMRKLKQMVTGS